MIRITGLKFLLCIFETSSLPASIPDFSIIISDHLVIWLIYII